MASPRDLVDLVFEVAQNDRSYFSVGYDAKGDWSASAFIIPNRVPIFMADPANGFIDWTELTEAEVDRLLKLRWEIGNQPGSRVDAITRLARTLDPLIGSIYYEPTDVA